MRLWELETDDADDLNAMLSTFGSDNEQIQLSAGKLGFRACAIELPGVSIHWYRFGQSLLFREVIKDDQFVFGFLLKGSPAINYNGHVIPVLQGVVQAPLTTHEYVTDRCMESLVLQVDMDLVEQLGWQPSPDLSRAVPEWRLNDLTNHCRRITAIARSTRSIDPWEEYELRDQLIDRLGPALAPWFVAGTTPASRGTARGSAYNLFRRAVRVVSEHHWDSPSVPVLAKCLNVSERTLYRAFDQWVGVGPHTFFTLRRLHGFRSQLLAEPPLRGLIARVAQAHGFDELSRLARAYKRHFGELPSQTLARRLEPSI